jgi:hypothetical protein
VTYGFHLPGGEVESAEPTGWGRLRRENATPATRSQDTGRVANG